MPQNLSQRIREFRRTVRELKTRARAQAARGRATNVNVSGRTNVQTAVNTGEAGSVQTASAVQHAPIRQQDGARKPRQS